MDVGHWWAKFSYENENDLSFYSMCNVLIIGLWFDCDKRADRFKSSIYNGTNFKTQISVSIQFWSGYSMWYRNYDWLMYIVTYPWELWAFNYSFESVEWIDNCAIQGIRSNTLCFIVVLICWSFGCRRPELKVSHREWHYQYHTGEINAHSTQIH